LYKENLENVVNNYLLFTKKLGEAKKKIANISELENNHINFLKKDNLEKEEKIKKYKKIIDDKLNYLQFCSSSLLALNQKLEQEKNLIQKKE
jgi:hypothetical protein